jgi:uncharacterized protein (TIGR02147 family)
MELIGQYFDYREYLKDELSQRVHLNPQYSLRAFARDVKISPQVLSSVMNGKKNISSEVAIELARKLNFSAEELSYFHDLVELAQAKTENLKDVIKYRLTKYEDNQNYRTVQEDVFKVIADWHHYAILELSLTDDFKSDPAWIAQRLGIPPIEVKAALKRLLSLEMLEQVRGELRKTVVNITSSHDVPSAAVRKMTGQLLTKAATALEDQSVAERDVGTITMAIDPKKLPEAKKRIRKFRRDLCQYLESGDRTEVFAFCTQLFALSANENKIGVSQ